MWVDAGQTDREGARVHLRRQIDQENFQGALYRMKLKFALLAALVAGLLPVAAVAQAAPAEPQPATPAASSAPAPAAAPAAAVAPAAQARQAPTLIPPSAVPARIALVAFEQAVYATNEGQRAIEDLRKKYEPQKTKLDELGAEIDSLKKQLQAAPATLPDDERASRLKTIDIKDKQYQRESDDFSTSSQADIQEALGKVAQKVDVVMRKYVSDNGYTLLLNVGDQQSPVMWASAQPNADITLALIEAYNAASKVAPLPPAAPGAARPKPAATTTPHTTTAKPAAK
jgi:outer membrane protein